MWHVFKRLPHNVRSRAKYLLPSIFWPLFNVAIFDGIMKLRLVGMLQITPNKSSIIIYQALEGGGKKLSSGKVSGKSRKIFH